MDNRVPESNLSQSQLRLFHRILTRFESPASPKAVKDFRSIEVSQLIKKYQTKKGEKLYLDEPLDSRTPLRISEIRFNHNSSKAYELIANLRNAFAHNRIQLDSNDSSILLIDNVHQNKVKMKGKIKFDTLKKLMETILGDHNLSDNEKNKIKKLNKRNKRKT